MAPRIRKKSKVHTIREVTSADLFPGSTVKRSTSVPKNMNGIVEDVSDGLASVYFKEIDINWLINVELLKAGWYVKKSK